MARRHFRRRDKKTPAYEIDVTTFLNLMVVLVPFLLITAVFSRLTIVELSLPSSADTTPVSSDTFRVEVIIRDTGLEITNGSAVIASLPKNQDQYDLDSLSELIVELKKQRPDVEAASVLVEPQVAYDHVIQVMDTVRALERPLAESLQQEYELVALFPDIAVGDAP